MIKEINDSSFNSEVMNSEKPVVVDFWATWCGPCRMLAPVMEEVDGELGGSIKFVKVNVDENPEVSQKFRIASIPTVMVFKDGNVVNQMVGFRPKQDVLKLVQQYK
jgi:thioredoxin 1